MKSWMIFMGLSWALVLGLTGWAFWRLLSDQGKKHFDPDGVGPAAPPVPGKASMTKPKQK